jgi:hydrogenase maturation protein HypF
MANIAQRIRVSGVVQGVGFRPFVWRLARDLMLNGWVRNDAQGVEIAVEGGDAQLAVLLERLSSEAPPLARIDAIETRSAEPQGMHGFVISESRAGQVSTSIGHDTAPCAACLAELFEPASRHWRHAFVTCTHCGPRYTVTRHLPYDRPQTSLAPFPLCPDCAREYADPADRRFHAETTCCLNCGPHLALLDAAGLPIDCDDVIAETLGRLRGGEIVAIKGLGGLNLVCDARNTGAVARLRERKSREAKPFALLLANAASARAFVEVDAAEQALLESAERPIVLLLKRPGADEALAGIAPGLAWLGLMLPSTPLQYLLFHEAIARSSGTAWLAEPQELTLVCTSANPGGEPLQKDNDKAIQALAGIADAFLLHNRDIVVRCDDSVLRAVPGGFQFIRRARGYTPRAIMLRESGPSVLACGAWYKNTVCITRGNEAFVSQHIGGLDNAATCGFFEETVAHLLGILDVQPEIVAHDLHPDFFNSRIGAEFAAQRGLPLVAVQHHHAHIASVLAEHGVDEPVIGLALDGNGMGSDGTSWGGELLRVDGAHFDRLGHLRHLRLPGGDRAAREPWRMVAAVLHDLGRADEIERRFTAYGAQLRQMLAGGMHSPLTSSLGRAFDAAAGLLGVRYISSFEGQAAMLLEGLAEQYGEVAAPEDAYVIDGSAMLDLRPLYRKLAICEDAAYGAAIFHATLAKALAEWAFEAARASGLTTVVCGGGCFINHRLTRDLTAHLMQRGLRVLHAHRLPPNDSGLSLGQAWIARKTLRVDH